MAFFGSAAGRCFAGAVIALAGLVTLFADGSRFVGIVMLVCGFIMIGQGLGIVPMRRSRR